jgi:hypothetical protein
MLFLEKIACPQGRRDDIPNQELVDNLYNEDKAFKVIVSRYYMRQGT